MKKQLYLFLLFFLSITTAFSQGLLRSGFNNSPASPSVSGSHIISWPAASASEYRAVAIEPGSGDIIAVGFVNLGTSGAPNRDIIISRFTKAGILNTAFDTDGHKVIDVNGALDDAYGLVISGSKIYVVGMTGAANPKSAYILSLNLDGTSNTSFNSGNPKIFNFRATLGTTGDVATCVIADGSGRLVVGGYSNSISGTITDDFAVARFTTAGAFDTQFNASATATGANPVVGANIFDIRNLIDGGTSTEDRCRSIALLPSGNIILTGDFSTSSSSVQYDFALVNLTDAGIRETTWGTYNGIIKFDISGSNNNDYPTSMVIDGSGNIYVAGYSLLNSTVASGLRNQISIIKTNSSGVLDASFDTDGKKVINLTDSLSQNPAGGATATSIAVYSGKIIVGGEFNGDFVTVRLNANGNTDAGFGTNGISKINIGTADAIEAIAVNGYEIYAVGTSFGGGATPSLLPSLAIVDIAYSQYGLPFNNIGFIAQKQANSVQLQWKPQIDQSLTLFTVERSTDGRNYRPIGSVSVNPSQTSNYSFLDNSPVAAVNYYRLAIRNSDDKVVFSNALAVRNSKASAGLEVFPNPASQLVYVQMPSNLRGKMNVRMNDVMGRTVATMSLDMFGESATTSLNVASLNKGIYTISVVDEQGSVISSKHFVKN